MDSQLLSPDDPHGLARAARERNPYPAYARMLGPPVFDPFWRGYLVTRHADVLAGFRHPGLSSDTMSAAMARARSPEILEMFGPLIRNLSAWVVGLDPPAHARVRALIAQAFTPQIVERLAPRVEAITEGLLDRVGDQVEFDAMASLAVPLPLQVIGELLGLPPEDAPMLKRWSGALLAFIGRSMRPRMEVAMEALEKIVEMQAYFERVIEERRKRPGADLVSALLASRDDGKQLAPQELVANLCALLFGGHETTTNLIGNGLWLLLGHPEQAELVRARPEAAAPAVEECLRLEPSAQFANRIAREDIELGGTAIPAGKRVFLVMAAANRDPAMFPDPDRFDIHRDHSRQTSFGHGPHFCAGAALARLEGRIALRAVLRRFPHLALAPQARDAPEWIDNITARSLERLPVITRG